MDEFLARIEEVSRQIVTMTDCGTLSDQNATLAAGSLDHLQIMLTELVRSEVRKNGVSRDVADRFAELEGRIRSLRDMVQNNGQGRKYPH